MTTHSGILAWRIPWTEETTIVHVVAKELDTTEQRNTHSKKQQNNGQNIMGWKLSWLSEPIYSDCFGERSAERTDFISLKLMICS